MGKPNISIPFAVTVGENGIIQNSNERLENMFAEYVTSGRAQVVRRQRACTRALSALAGEKRCIERHNGLHYLIVGSTFYSWDGTTLTTLGTLASSTGRCSMIFNDNDQVMISDGIILVWWNGSALANVTNAAGFVPGKLAYLGGYGIVNAVGTDQFYITAANDFSAIDPLDFATAESNPDALQTVFVDHNEIWLAGTETIEIWQDVGGTDFPFQAVTNAKIERGTAAALSFASEDNTVSFLGDDLIVYRAEGYRPIRISNYAVEEAIRNCSNISDAYAFIYTIAGNKFYTLTIPGELTAQFNFATNLWNFATTYGQSDWQIISSNGHKSDYVLSPTGICSLTPDLNQDESITVVRLARSAPGYANGLQINMPEFFADVMVGRCAIGITAEVMLRVALDAETFGNIHVRSLGAIGEYTTRPMWRGLGQGRKPVLELSASGDFEFAIMGTLLNTSVGNS